MAEAGFYTHPSAARVTNQWERGGLSWTELGTRVWHEVQKDGLLGRAAQLAYYFLLALFPLLLFFTALIGLFPINAPTSALLEYARQVIPSEAFGLVERYLDNVVHGSGTDVLSLGIIGALWASSSGMTAIMEALNVAYDTAETRPFWKVRLLGILLTLCLTGLIILSATLVVYGGFVLDWATHFFALTLVSELTWRLVRWPLAIGLMLVAMAIIYYACPDVEQPWRWVTPGAVFAVLMWLLVSLAFKYYVQHFGNYNVAYGSIGGVIVLMLWLYLSGAVILLGGQINAEIEAAARQQSLPDSTLRS